MLIEKLKVGDCLSETSYYKCVKVGKNQSVFKNLKDGQDVALSNNYVNDYLQSANFYDEEVFVTKEDTYWTAHNVYQAPEGTRVGDLKALGIRSIFSNIGSEVFTVCYDKLPKNKTIKKLNEERENQISLLIQSVEKAQQQKKGVEERILKGVLEAAKLAMVQLQNNPIETVVVEERILTGYKLSFSSKTGLYRVYDMVNEGKRQMNLPTVKWLIVNNVKYIVK